MRKSACRAGGLLTAIVLCISPLCMVAMGEEASAVAVSEQFTDGEVTPKDREVTAIDSKTLTDLEFDVINAKSGDTEAMGSVATDTIGMIANIPDSEKLAQLVEEATAKAKDKASSEADAEAKETSKSEKKDETPTSDKEAPDKAKESNIEATETSMESQVEGYDSRIPLEAHLQAIVIDIEKRTGISRWVMYEIMWRESRFQKTVTNRNKNGTTDTGLCQINSANWGWLQAEGINPHNPEGNIRAMGRMLEKLSNKGYSLEQVLAAYGSGEGGMLAGRGFDKARILIERANRRAVLEDIVRERVVLV